MPNANRIDVEDTRLKVIEIVLSALNTSKSQAGRASAKPGSHGIPKAEWLRLVGYLSVTANGLLRNEDLGDTKRRIDLMMKEIAELRDAAEKRRTATTAAAKP